MQITVSSTSMMKPILCSDANSLSPIKHPQRILGLLEHPELQSAENSVTVYDRPTCPGPHSSPQPWQSFLHIPDNQGQQRAAIFGFMFDGVHTWYQLWHFKKAKTSWLLHNDGMDYRPYAIIAMDALVTLMPQWNGDLYMSLNNSRDDSGTKQSLYNLPTSGTVRDYELHISDAATTATGQLWFLVTIKVMDTTAQKHERDAHLSTGWISTETQLTRVA